MHSASAYFDLGPVTGRSRLCRWHQQEPCNPHLGRATLLKTNLYYTQNIHACVLDFQHIKQDLSFTTSARET